MRKQRLVSLILAAWIAGCPSGDSKEKASGDDNTANVTPNGKNDPEKDGGTAGQGEAGNGGSDASTGGTGAATDAGMKPSDVPLAELPDAFASALCGALQDCLGPSKYREFTQREACPKAVAAQLRATDFAYMDMAISAGRVLYNPAKLAECQDGIRALKCDALSHSFPQACVDVLDGNVALGEKCLISAECQGAAFCAGSLACPSTCAELLAEGKTCAATGECQDGMVCAGAKCTYAPRDGAACGGTAGMFCALGQSCVGSTDTASGKCTPNDEVQVGAAGDVCTPGGTLCKEGLSCVFDGKGGFVCVAAAKSGEACHLGLPGQCPNDEYCNAKDVSMQSTCVKLPAAGKPCALDGLCAGGTTCVKELAANVCRAIEDNGGKCATDAVCRSGRCEAGTCAPPIVCK